MKSTADMIYLVIEIAVGAAALIAGVYYGIAKGKSSISDDSVKRSKEALDQLTATVTALQTQNGIQATQIAKGEQESKEQATTIAKLNGVVDTLKTIPLVKIEEHMGKSEKHMADANQILGKILPLLAKVEK